jgi:hypothetical protein
MSSRPIVSSGVAFSVTREELLKHNTTDCQFGLGLVSIADYPETARLVEIGMRTAFFAFVCAASALVTLHFSSGAAMAGGSLFSRHHYPPPAFYVVRPSHSLNPRARRVFRRHCPSGRIYGPRGTYYPKYGHRFYRADW